MLGSTPEPTEPSKADEEEEVEMPEAEESSEEATLQVLPIQIGDIVFICRHQPMRAISRTISRSQSSHQTPVSESSKKMTRFTLCAEGIADNKVTGIVADEWLKTTNMCLFRIETPSTMGAASELESRADKESFKKSQGAVLKFGQEIQLRHLHSNRFLSLDLLAAADSPGAWSVCVNEPKEGLCRQISLLPFNRSRNIGDPIKYDEAVSVVFQSDNLKYFLQSQPLGSDMLDVNSTHKPASWRFLQYEPFDESREALRFGEIMTIKNSKLWMYMGLQKDKRSNQYMNRRESSAMSSRRSSVRVEDLDTREPVLMKADFEDYSHYWVLQNTNVMVGGAVTWKSKFYIKNALTGQFLGPRLKLVSRPDPNFYFYFPKPDSFTPESLIPNGYALMIKCKGDMVLAPDSKKSNEEALDHLVPIISTESTWESGEVGMALEVLGPDQRESLFEFDYASSAQRSFFNLINSLFPKFVDAKKSINSFKVASEKPGRKSWELVEQLEKRLKTMLAALKDVNTIIRNSSGSELESIQNILAGLRFHSILIEIASVLHTLFESKAILEISTEALIGLAKSNLVAIWDLLNDVALENEVAARKIAEHQSYLCELLKYDTRRIGALLTEVFRLVDPEIKDPKQFYYQWCGRLESLTKQNLQEQVIYMRIIRNLCEIGDMGQLEYQTEIVNHLFHSDIAISLIVFSQHLGEYTVHFGSKGKAIDVDEFKQLNPDLAPFVKENSDGQPIVLLSFVSGLEDYVEYVQTALLLLYSICRGQCESARQCVAERLGITVSTALQIAQDFSVHIEMRQAFLLLLEALCITVPPFEPYSENDTSFSYADIRMLEGKESFRQPLFDTNADNPYVVQCLHIVFEFWINKELPPAMEKKELFGQLKFLLAMLKLTSAVVEYRHCTELYALLVLKSVQYLLVGFTAAAKSYEKQHWGARLVSLATVKGVEDRKIRLLVNELVAGVLTAILAIKKSGRRIVLMQVISLFLSELGIQDSLSLVTFSDRIDAVLKEIVSSDRGDKMIADYIKRVDKTKKTPDMSMTIALVAQSTLPLEGYLPELDLKPIVNGAPPLKEIFIRLILEWSSFSTVLKNKMINVMNEVFKEKKLFNKFLKTSDVISLGPISVIYNRLRWVKENSELSSLFVRAKFEALMMGKSKSLARIIQTLEYLINFCHPRNGFTEFVLQKTQNIMRQLGLLKEVMMLWQLVQYLDKLGKGNDSPAIRLKSALVSFLLYFIKGNPANVKCLAKSLTPTHYIMTVMQYPALLRLVNDFGHLAIRDVTRLLIYILEVVQQSDRDLRAMSFFECMMIDRQGQVKRTIQNVASTLLSEKISQSLDMISERPLYVATLIENLALSAEDNTPVITQCRHLISFSHLQEMMRTENNPAVLSALCYFLYTVYVKKLDGAKDAKEVKMLEKVADISDILTRVISIANDLMKEPKEVLSFAREGSYSLVFFTKNPAYAEIQANLSHYSPELTNWTFLCRERDGRLSGALKYLVDIVKTVELDITVQPCLTDFYNAMSCCKAKLVCMQQELSDLVCLDPLIQVFAQALAQLKEALAKIQVEVFDEMFSSVVYPLEPETFDYLREATRSALIFSLDLTTEAAVEVDKSMGRMMDEGFKHFTKLFSTESEGDYIGTIVSLIDPRLKRGNDLNKNEVKDLISSLGDKTRRLQKLFTSSKQRTLFFKIIQGIVPEEEMSEFKIQLNPFFKETDVIGYALIAGLKHESNEEVMAALSFLHKLFLLQSPEFMEEFRISLNENSFAYPLFMKIQGELSRAKAYIYNEVHFARNKKRKEELGLSTDSIPKAGKKEAPAETKEYNILVKMLDFIQICCDNCNAPFQNFYRVQGNTEGKADVDLVTALANFLIDIRMAKEMLYTHPTIYAIMSAGLGAFVDYVTGPCVENQMFLGNNVRIYLLLNMLISISQNKTDLKCINIHARCIKFLCALLEGHPDPSVPETMSRFLSLSMIRQGCEDAYNSFIKGHEEDISLERKYLSPEVRGVVENSLQQAILLMKMKAVGVIHDELIKFEAPWTDDRYSFGFYQRYTGYVEIDRNGNGELEAHLYPVPWKCKYITASTRQSVIVNVSRASHQEKIEDFMGQVELCTMEMEHQQILWCSKTFKSFSERWALFGKLSYYIALLINIVLLLTIDTADYSNLTNNAMAFTVVAILGIMQTCAYMSCFFFNLVEYYPQALTSSKPQPKEFDMDQFPKVDNSDSQLMYGFHASLASDAKKDYGTELQEQLRSTLLNFELYYTYAYFLLSIIAVYLPVFYSFLLLDVIKQTPELVNVLKSVTQNFRQLVLTMWLGVILIYLFSIAAFVYYFEYYNPENGVTCDTLWNCFFSTLNLGIRNDGDYMDIPSFDEYWSRMVFDMMFFMIIIIINLNIIFGIIIDTFAELRDERTQVLEDIHNRCYICGSERSIIELKGSGWSYHFMREHSVFAYLSFLVYINDKKVYECSGLEKHVKECFTYTNTSFMPKTSIQMEKGDKEVEIKTGDDD